VITSEEPDTLVISVPGVGALAEGESATFEFDRHGGREQGFVLVHRTGLVAFANRCPHWNVDLDLGDAHFYDPADDRIFCKNHGATFIPESGLCDFGPCGGAYLERFEVERQGQDAQVRVRRLRIIAG
jgi:nitrite reductase/ring-hydroxylating ferredoxin subunit